MHASAEACESRRAIVGGILRAAQLIWRTAYYIKPNRKQMAESVVHYVGISVNYDFFRVDNATKLNNIIDQRGDKILHKLKQRS